MFSIYTYNIGKHDHLKMGNINIYMKFYLREVPNSNPPNHPTKHGGWIAMTQ